jgi:predicted nuclease with TOPRIM domain
MSCCDCQSKNIIISTLQNNFNSVNHEMSQLRGDTFRELEHAKREMIKDFDLKLDQKDEEIKELQFTLKELQKDKQRLLQNIKYYLDKNTAIQQRLNNILKIIDFEADMPD